MADKMLRVLVAAADTSDLLVLRRLLRDTPYHVEAARSAAQALKALAERKYAAVVTDDERLAGMSGPQLLADVEKMQPEALRFLIIINERRQQLAAPARAGRFRVFVRPFFAPHVRAALLEHLALLAPKTGTRSRELAASRNAAQPTGKATVAPARVTGISRIKRAPQAERFVESEPTNALSRPPTLSGLDGDTRPYELASSGTAVRRRMLLTLAELVEAKAGHSSGHAGRVCALASALAHVAGLRGADLEAIEEAALLHDVGELAIHEPVLMKRRRLTPAEQREIHCHVESGYQVARSSGLGKMVLQAIRHHHERWDGKGYPSALAGEKIPQAARLIAVADTWDALATQRPYRDVITPVDECERTLVLLGGSQLDPNLVELFLVRKLYEIIDWADPPRGGANLLEPPWTSGA